MKLITVLFFLILLSAVAFSQGNDLSDILRPDKLAEAEATRLGGEVFKIFPRGTFTDSEIADKNSPLGLRGGGAFYSFTKRSHSYNKIPQINLDQGYIRASGFAGANYGFLLDLGSLPLNQVSTDLEALQFLLDYVPPKLISEIREEQKKSYKYEADGLIFERRLRAEVGHTFLLRAINFGEADTCVALQILSKNADESLNIVWKRLKDFEVPQISNPNDEALR